VGLDRNSPLAAGGFASGDNNLDSEILERLQVCRGGAGIGDECRQLRDRPYECEALLAEFTMIDQRDAHPCGFDDGLLDCCLGMVSCGHAIAWIYATDSQKGLIDANFTERPLCPDSRQIKHIPLQVATDTHYIHLRIALQLAKNKWGICDHCQAIAVLQSGSDLRNGGAPFQEDGVAVEDHLRGLGRDGLLFFAIRTSKGVVRRLEIGGRGLGDRASVGTNEQPLAFEIRQIPSDRRRRHSKDFDEFRSAYSALLRKEFGNSEPPFFRQQ